MSSINLASILGDAKKTAPPYAYFANNTNNSTSSYSANTTGPILNFGATSKSGDATLLAAFNATNATFTAPYNGSFRFNGWMQWLNGNQSTSYNLYISNSGTTSNYIHAMNYAGVTPFSYTVVLTAGQTAQITGVCSAAWGSYANSLTITTTEKFQ